MLRKERTGELYKVTAHNSSTYEITEASSLEAGSDIREYVTLLDANHHFTKYEPKQLSKEEVK